ncbi:MAG: hypothetical protein OHK0039_00800 [Bacteroidia bacterium]
MLRYFISKEFLITLAGLAGLGLFLYLAVFFWILPAYTRHGDGLLVPDVSEMPVQEAMQVLKKAGLRPVQNDSIFIEDLPAGVVIKQYPLPYARVKPKRSISLTINKSEPPMVTMPNLVEPSISIYHARNKLENWNLAVGKVTRVPDLASGVVLRALYGGKDIKPGTRIPQGSKIDLIVGAGPGSKIAVPDLEGYSYEDALAVLKQMGLQVGFVQYVPGGPDNMQGMVFGQTPTARFGDSIALGQYIDLRVYGTEPEAQEGIIIEEVEDDGN